MNFIPLKDNQSTQIMKRTIIICAMLLSLITIETIGQNLFVQADLPVRTVRRFGISFDMGWNSLVGVGPTLQYYASPHFGIDAGVGLSGVGWKFSGRGRYLFLDKKFSPFLAAGFIYGTGSLGAEVENQYEGNTIRFVLTQSPFIQLTFGGDLVASGGFFLMFDVGYAILLSENVEIKSGIPSADQLRAMDIAYGSGIVIEVGLGYMFKNRK